MFSLTGLGVSRRCRPKTCSCRSIRSIIARMNLSIRSRKKSRCPRSSVSIVSVRSCKLWTVEVDAALCCCWVLQIIVCRCFVVCCVVLMVSRLLLLPPQSHSCLQVSHNATDNTVATRKMSTIIVLSLCSSNYCIQLWCCLLCFGHGSQAAAAAASMPLLEGLIVLLSWRWKNIQNWCTKYNIIATLKNYPQFLQFYFVSTLSNN